MDEYRLTGMAIYKDQVDHVFPDDPEKLILGDPEKWPEKPLSAALGCVRNGKPYTMYEKNAYPVHERCWSLMLRVLDIGLVEKHLDSSVKVLCQQAEKNRNAKNPLVNMQGYWREPKKRYKDISWEEPEKYAKACEQQMSCTDDSCFNCFYAPIEPFNIPELRALLDHQETILEESAQGEEKVNQNDLAPQMTKRRRKVVQKSLESCSHQMSLRVNRIDTRHVRVPIEIILLVMDHLHEHHDIQALVQVFPQWRSMIPHGYWRGRCVKDFILEEPLPAADALDWKYVYLNIGQLLSKSPGWIFKRHVLKCLGRTKALFLRDVAQKSKKFLI